MKELKNAVRTYDESNITINTYNTLIGVNLIIGVIITAIATMAFKNNSTSFGIYKLYPPFSGKNSSKIMVSTFTKDDDFNVLYRDRGIA